MSNDESAQPLSPDQVQAKYAELRPQYARFTEKLESLLRELLTEEAIDFHLLESRTKDLSSFREKITRSSKSYSDPISELTDLSGLRIISYYQDDAESIGRLIESEFLADSQQSIEHAPQASEFGYRSAHYIVRLSEKRSLLREWESFTDLKAEIQVRTVLQHAWAAISHKLQYKREGDVPASLRRKLFRLSALFELADDEFVSLRDASGNLTRAISNQLSAGDTRLPLDYLSVGQFMAKSPIVAELSAIAAEIGFDFDEPDDPNLSDSDALSDLIELAGLAEITTLTELESLLADAIRWANEYLQEQFIESGRPAKHSWYVTPEFVCELILIRAKVERLRVGNLLRLGWDRRIAKRVFDVAQTFQPNGA